MNFRFIGVFILSFLTSCQVYKSDFDCPPCKGVPCTSVSDIQKMIVETPDGGPDIFLDVLPSEFASFCPGKNCQKPGRCSNSKPMRKRIWVNEDRSDKTTTQGYFIYFNDSCKEDCCQ